MTSRSECDDFAAGILEEMQRAKEEMQKWAEDSQRELENLQVSVRCLLSLQSRYRETDY
jgi:Zn-dependent peptidase ImmA (M78 family)